MQVQGRTVRKPYSELRYDPESGTFSLRVDDEKDLAFWLTVHFDQSELDKARLEADVKPSIQIWEWDDAPEAYKLTNGCDKDWVAYIPAYLVNRPMLWMDSGTAFGPCDVTDHTLPDGSLVRIGAHG
jgi:hypothetical protein